MNYAQVMDMLHAYEAAHNRRPTCIKVGCAAYNSMRREIPLMYWEFGPSGAPMINGALVLVHPTYETSIA